MMPGSHTASGNGSSRADTKASVDNVGGNTLSVTRRSVTT
jgi:hypothetical protein